MQKTYTKVEKQEIYNKALDHWGEKLQLIMLIEESAELQQATTKILRSSNLHYTRNFLEEIADLTIILEQIQYYYEKIMGYNYKEKLKYIKHKKLKRLEKWLEKK